jgi:glycosyltransferase involved in cell wall biosynthesis
MASPAEPPLEVTGRFTIITSTFNCAASLQITAQSIRDQTYKNIQWIVADGGSNDSTIEVIEQNLDIVTNWFSENDEGIYDAWNKACRLIDGEWVIFLGAGDQLSDATVLGRMYGVCQSLKNETVIVYGNVWVRGPTGNNRYLSRKPQLDHYEFGRLAYPHHQGVFQSRALFIDVDKPFDSTYKIAADGKFMLMAAQKGRLIHADFIVAVVTDDGISNDYRNIFLGRLEFKRLCKELNIHVPLMHRISYDCACLVRHILHRILTKKIVKQVQAIRDRFRQ